MSAPAWLPWLSRSSFRALNWADNWLGLPESITATLAFRRAWRSHLKAPLKTRSLWVHGASVGELEDVAAFFGDPALLARAGYSPESVVLTASSVSAQRTLAKWRERLPFAYCGPLPPEERRETRDFLQALQPELLLMSHADIWPELLAQALPQLRRGCLWLPDSAQRGRWLGQRCLAPALRAVAARSASDQKQLQHDLAGHRIHLLGNPRLDRIAARLAKAQSSDEHPLAHLDAAPRSGKVSLLLGSCWSEDAAMLAQALPQLSAEQRARLQLVAIPHDVRNASVGARIQALLPTARVLNVEGVLLESYRDFSAAWVGGGYRSGLHNVLEPALWGLPVICGPRLAAQPEAPQLQHAGLLHVASDASHALTRLQSLLDPAHLARQQQAARACARELQASVGASARLADLIASM